MYIPRIEAVVKKTGKKVLVTDAPYFLGILRLYNPTHEDEYGEEYNDNDLIFLEPRLQ